MAALGTDAGQEPRSSQDLYLEVRRALAHLYDSVYLQRSPLAASLQAGLNERIAPGQEAKALRQVLLEAIDELAPGGNVPLRSEERRSYAVLRGRYVDQRPMEELADLLGLSPRQLRRDLHAGLEAVTDVMARRLGWLGGWASSGGLAEPSDGSLVSAEIEALCAETGPVNLCVEVRDVEALVSPLAREAGVVLQDWGVPESVVVRANRVVLRQVLLAIYTWVLQHRPARTVGSRVEHVSDREGIFELHVGGEAPRGQGVPVPEEVAPPELVSVLHGRFECLSGPGEGLVCRLTVPGMPMHAVLLIDDNRSIHHLFRRYLTGLPYRLLSAYDAPTGLAMAQSARPEAIIVDIMMPDQDGWELLSALKDLSATRQTPVLICSVLDQEVLAISLSASGYLKKPVTQNALLTALEALGIPQTG